MKIPFKFRSIPAYVYDGDGRFPTAIIVGRDKRMERKAQIRRFLKLNDRDDA